MDRRTHLPLGSAANIFSAFPTFNGTATRLMLWPLETWLQLQLEALSVVAPAAADWMERRREGAAAAIDAIERLSASKDAQEAAKVQSDWMTAETQRLEADVRAAADHAALFVRAMEKASRTRTEAAPKAAA
jgi:hypothetical protein